MAVDTFRGKTINRQQYKKLCQCYSLIYPVDMNEAKEGLQNAHTFRRKVKKMDALLRIEHLTKLAMEKECHGDRS